MAGENLSNQVVLYLPRSLDRRYTEIWRNENILPQILDVTLAEIRWHSQSDLRERVAPIKLREKLIAADI